ncbi:helix-turn-helix domain-containing protein [Amycolatopsis mediterranei]|uniref:helix-turn-helix domain-containing protein n=1 Tax=Amycolatopsis mediterranei TaxID=33910 RepID=UPI00341D65B9
MAVTETRRAGSASPRTANLAAVLRALRSRPQPAARCGLAKSAVPRLLAELAERGLVRAAGVLPGHGRPSRLVELPGEHAYALALGIEADRVSTLVTDLSGRVLAERAETVDVAALGPAAGMAELARLARSVLPGPPAGVAIAVPGLADPAAVLRFAPALRRRDAEIAGLVAARPGVPAAAIAGGRRAVTAVHEPGVAPGVALSTVVDVLDPDVAVTALPAQAAPSAGEVCA